jgi:phospho-N-acetylmuramoyl-pentapeptide-transferase
MAGSASLLICMFLGPRFIDYLRLKEFGQQIREEGPKGHVVKQGTPAMGGLLIMIAMAVPFLVFSDRTVPAVTAFFVTLGCAAIGFVDDWTKVSRRRSLGLAGRWKLIWLGAITVVVGFVAARGLDEPLTTDVYLPLLDVDLPLGWGWYVLLYFIIAGFANGVNLTDGVDGLAAGTTTISLLTYTAMSLVAALASIRAVGAADQVDLDLAILGASLIGASIGFLWYNAFPAQVFMGDTGSMGLGGAIAAFAIMTQTESLLILIGGIFVIEALSVIVQVVSFKWFGRRVLLMAPLHHHFEMKAWSETRITVRFWIVTAMLCACGFVLYYRYASEFAS